MSYYQGDYYQGDFFKKLGKGIKRLGKNIGRAVKAVAPVAGILLPAFGAATLVGRGVAAAGKIKRAGRTLRDVKKSLQPQPMEMMNNMVQATSQGVPQNRWNLQGANLRAWREQGSMTGGMGAYPVYTLDGPGGTRSTTTAARRTRAARAGYRRRKATTRRRPTTRRRRRRATRRRS